MSLTINTSRTLMTIESTLLDSFIASPASYTNVKVTIYKNSTTTSTTEIYTNADPITTTTNVASNGDVETILPTFFGVGNTTFEQGVYHVVVSLLSPSESSTEEYCLYVENGLKCLVDDVLIDESKDVKNRILEGLKYQSLVSSTECPCKCGQKIELYLNLIDSIDNCTAC